MTLRHPQRYDHTNAQKHGSKNEKFNKVITKCYNKNACGSKITVRAGDRKQEVYNWWPNIQAKYVCMPTQLQLSKVKCCILYRNMYKIFGKCFIKVILIA